MEGRADVPTFTSEVLASPVEIAGPVRVVFYASSSAGYRFCRAPAGCGPQGNSRKLSQGVLRARYRQSFAQPELLTPGQIERYELRLDDAANTFLAGHRIRVSITSSAHRYVFENHNTGKDPGEDTEYQTALQRIYWGGPYGSRLELRLVPQGQNRA